MSIEYITVPAPVQSHLPLLLHITFAAAVAVSRYFTKWLHDGKQGVMIDQGVNKSPALSASRRGEFMIVLKNAAVIGGAGEQPGQNTTIVINGSRIERVGPDTGLTNGADIVFDLKGRYVMAGLIDAHVHLGGADNLDYPGIGGRHETYDYLDSRVKALKWGVTAIRSAGDYTPEIFCFRDEVNLCKHISPRIVAAGRMIQARGGHPIYTVFGANETIAAGATVLADETTDLEKEIGKLVDEGADWIKAVISEVNKLDYPATVPRLSTGQIKLIADTAHKYGKPCMIHVDDARHMREAAEAGADSIEHVFSVGATETEIDDDLIELLVKKQIYVVPTVFSIYAHENPKGSRALVYEKLLEQVNRLIKAGVRIGAGSDSNIPFVSLGESLHDELSQLVKCGMTPADAIAAATSVNAKLLRKENEIGAVSPGYYADLLVVDGDPARDISNTKNIYLVIMNGRVLVDNTGKEW